MTIVKTFLFFLHILHVTHYSLTFFHIGNVRFFCSVHEEKNNFTNKQACFSFLSYKISNQRPHSRTTTDTPLITTMFDRSQNLESCRLVILKSSACKHKAFECTYWRSVIDFVEIFDDPDVCFNHVKGINAETVFLIVENELYEQIITNTRESCVIYKIYIFDATNDAYKQATTEK